MKLYSEITVDLFNAAPLPIIWAQQNNAGRGALITLVAGSKVINPAGETIQIYVKKPDGKKVYAPCIVREDGRIQIDFTNQMLMISGRIQAELEMVSGTDRITTPIFIIEVQPSNIDGDAIQSSDEFDALQEAIGFAQNALNGYQIRVVDELPAAPEDNVIYLIREE